MFSWSAALLVYLYVLVDPQRKLSYRPVETHSDLACLQVVSHLFFGPFTIAVDLQLRPPHPYMGCLFLAKTTYASVSLC